jgi:hypothetical protein
VQKIHLWALEKIVLKAVRLYADWLPIKTANRKPARLRGPDWRHVRLIAIGKFMKNLPVLTGVDFTPGGRRITPR